MPPALLVVRNGQLISSSDARVSVFNPAIYGAFGIYDSMQVVGGVAFEQEAHLHRLAHSAAVLGLPLPAGLDIIAGWVRQAIEANAAVNCTLRLFVVGPENGGEVTAYLWPQPSPAYPAAYYADGAPAITFEARRYLPQAKSLNTLTSFMAQRAARAADAHEALLHHAGCLTEGSNSNLFVVSEGLVVTPPTAEVLPGVTRDIVMMLARREGIPLREAAVPLAGLDAWDECFITSSSRHVMPISHLDGRPVGNGRVGPVTRRLMDVFEAYFQERTGAH